MNLRSLLQLQVIYCIIGILFNAASFIMIKNGQEALTPTVPIEGFIAMSIYGIFLLSGYFRKINLYRILMVISIILFGYGGVIKHFFTYPESPELYHSLFVGIIGGSINVFGLILNLFAVFGKFEK